MNKVVIHVGFYAIEMPEDSQLKFEDILARLYDLPESERTLQSIETPLRLQRHVIAENVISGKTVIEGELVRIRMTGLPPVAGISGGLKDLNLQSDEGLGETCVFLYHPGLQVLLFQTTQAGASVKAFLQYMCELGEKHLGFQGDIHAHPIISLDAMQRLAKMIKTRVFEYRLRLPQANSAEFLKDQDLGVKEEIQVMNKYKAPWISIKLSVGNLIDESLDHHVVRRAIQDLTQMGNRLVQNNQVPSTSRIKISGRGENDETILIKNLLNETIRESIKISAKSTRHTIYATRRDALREAWQNREDEISKFRTSE
jgi:hypothetical protein